MRNILFVLILLLISNLSYSQKWKRYRKEVMVGLGTSHYFGDIGGAREGGGSDLDIESTRMSFLLGGRYRLSDDMALKGSLILGLFKGSDLDSKNEIRNFAFKTSMYETTVQFEYSLIPEKPQVSYSIMDLRGGYKVRTFNINTYVFAGFGASFFSTQYEADLVNEDIGDYSKFAFVFPIGIGFKYLIDNSKSVGLEIGDRFTTSDYIDGYTSEWSKANDVYMFAIFNFIYKLQKSKKAPMF